MFYNPCLAKFIRKLDLDVIHTYAEFSLGIFRRAMAREKNYAMI
jgi:1,2-diacylglycerol 3-alpha-glucosyltransferase